MAMRKMAAIAQQTEAGYLRAAIVWDLYVGTMGCGLVCLQQLESFVIHSLQAPVSCLASLSAILAS